MLSKRFRKELHINALEGIEALKPSSYGGNREHEMARSVQQGELWTERSWVALESPGELFQNGRLINDNLLN